VPLTPRTRIRLAAVAMIRNVVFAPRAVNREAARDQLSPAEWCTAPGERVVWKR
jgi:hypothetical protein